jgi:RNA polymerase sigma factor (sigma-70 family)
MVGRGDVFSGILEVAAARKSKAVVNAASKTTNRRCVPLPIYSLQKRRNVMEKYTREAEVALFRGAQAGDAESLATLMRQHERLVHRVVRRQWSGGWRYADVVHEGRIGLWQAILNYDPQRGTAFATYAWPAIARQVWRAVAQRVPVEGAGLLAETGDTLVDAQHVALQRRVQRALAVMIAQLPARQAWLVQHYYGLAGREGNSLRELGQRLACRHQGIWYHMQRALRWLRHPAHSGTLRGLLEYQRRSDYRAALRPRGRQR